jgi:hypothetical protein
VVHYPPDPERVRTLLLFEHPRQPYESWWSIHVVIFRLLDVRFLPSLSSIKTALLLIRTIW